MEEQDEDKFKQEMANLITLWEVTEPKFTLYFTKTYASWAGKQLNISTIECVNNTDTVLQHREKWA